MQFFLNILSFGILYSVFLNSAIATSLSIDPVRLSISKNTPVQSIKLTNKNEHDIVLQFERNEWKQDQQANNTLIPTQDFIIAPEIVNIPAGKIQLVRIAYQKNLPKNKEKTYRLIMREVIPENNPNVPYTGSDFALKVSMPLFIKPDIKLKTQYDWTITDNKKEEKPTILKISNTGTKHILITKLQFLDTQKKIVFEQEKLFKYILPKSTATFNVDLPNEILNNPKKYQLILPNQE